MGHVGLALGMIALGCVAPINIIRIVATTGANNPSNDYLDYVQLLGAILSGTYDWRRYFVDTLIGGAHSLALPILVRLAVIGLTHWNIYLEMYVGIAAAAIKLFLLQAALTRFTRSPLRWLLFPVLSALVFSESQINVFTYGDVALEIQLSQLGVALCIWGVVRFPRTWAAIVLVIIGGSIASLSGGGGPLIWPVSFLALVILGFRQRRQYAVWLAAGILANLPYVYNVLLVPDNGARPAITLFDPAFYIEALGWPFAPAFSVGMAHSVGLLAFALCLSGVALLFLAPQRQPLTDALPALLLLAFGLANTWLIGAFRGRGGSGIAPWYTSHFLIVWYGLVGLAFLAVPRSLRLLSSINARMRVRHALTLIWSADVFLALGVIYLGSNLTYNDKVMYLYSRSPASASCLRNYSVAPTYCEQYVFQWGIGHPPELRQLGSFLAKYHLSVFAPHQEWTLQGDYTLYNVRIHEHLGLPHPFWSPDLTNRQLPWSDYHHLNLFLHTPNSLVWTVHLPHDVVRADLHSAVAISTSAPTWQASPGITFRVQVDRAAQPAQPLFQRHLAEGDRRWEPFVAHLAPYAGQTISLRFGSRGGTSIVNDWAMYRYPYIDVVTNPAPGQIESPESPPVAIRPTAGDARFALTDTSMWEVRDLQPMPSAPSSPPTWIAGPEPVFQTEHSLNLCLADYRYLAVTMAAPARVRPRYMEVVMKLEHNGWSDMVVPLDMPLHAGSDLHHYLYDLKLIDQPDGTRLVGLRFFPLVAQGHPKGARLTIRGLRLIRGKQPPACAG